MKMIKPMILAAMMGLQMNPAFAQEDNVVEQINITSDAVKVALEEFSTSSVNEHLSYDTEIKLNEFNKKAQSALTKYEADIRIRVLSSFPALVNQYNSVVKNQSLGESKKGILNGLLTHLKTMAEGKSDIYRTTYLELFSVLPDVPVLYDYQGSYNNNYTVYYLSFDTGRFRNKYMGDLYFSNGKKIKVEESSSELYHSSEIIDFLEELKILPKDYARSKVLEDCYTNTCFYQMLSKYTVWSAMIKTKLGRVITITLDDGQSISITPHSNRSGSSIFVVDKYLSSIETEGLINNLPYEISEERLSVLTEINKELQGRGNCKTIKKLKERLCQETSEGCLQNSEAELFKDRFNSKISCLANN